MQGSGHGTKVAGLSPTFRCKASAHGRLHVSTHGTATKDGWALSSAIWHLLCQVRMAIDRWEQKTAVVVHACMMAFHPLGCCVCRAW